MMAIQFFGNQKTIVNQLDQVNRDAQSSAEKLTSGKAVNKAADGAAELAISTRRETLIQSGEMAKQGLQMGQSLIEATNGNLTQLKEMTQVMREVTLQALSETFNDDNREQMQSMVSELKAGFNQMATSQTFNEQATLDTKHTITVPAGPGLNNVMDIEFESFADDVVGSHHFKVDAAGFIAAQTITVQSPYHDPIDVVIGSGDLVETVIQKFNAATSGVSIEARGNDVETFTRTIGGSYYNIAAADLTYSTTEPDFTTTHSLPAFDASSTSSAAFATALKAFADDVVANAPTELSTSVSYSAPPNITSGGETTLNGTLPAQNLTVTGYSGTTTVSVPALNKTSLDTQASIDAINAATGSTGVAATAYGDNKYIKTTGSIVEFELTTKAGSTVISQTFNTVPDANGYLNNDANWSALKAQVEAATGETAYIGNRYWTDTSVTPSVSRSESGYLNMNFPDDSAVWIENTSQQAGEDWTLADYTFFSGTNMEVAGTTMMVTPDVSLSDVSGQTPTAFRAETSAFTSTSLFDYAARGYTTELEFKDLEENFQISGTGGLVSGTLTASSAGVTQTGISFDSWHEYELLTTDGSNSLFNSATNSSHLKALKDVDLNDTAELDDALVVMDKTMERILYQEVMNGATENRIEHAINQLTNNLQQTAASNSKVMDADYAKEAANLAKANILQSSASSLMAHETDHMMNSIKQLLDATDLK